MKGRGSRKGVIIEWNGMCLFNSKYEDGFCMNKVKSKKENKRKTSWSMIMTWIFIVAEKQGFEPWRRLHDLPVFKTGPFNHLGTSPYLVARVRLELTTFRVWTGCSSQLSYLAKYIRKIEMVGMTGFEPATPCTPCKCTTKLCYIPMCNLFLMHERL